MNYPLDLSVVVPLYNEAESLPELAEWIARVANAQGLSWEVIFIDDGSKDSSWQVIEELHRQNPAFRGIRFQRNYGKSPALNEGFKIAQGAVVITMDADLQDSPDEIPELMRKIKEEKFDLVSGWKQKRYDPISKTVPTKLFNWATRKMSGIQLNDFNCGLKAYRGDVVKSIEIYGDMHRYIPVLAKQAGYSRIGEQVVQHRERKYGTTKFGLNRFAHGILDLVSVSFMGRFGKRPMHFFGAWGLVSFLLGFALTVYLFIVKLVNIYTHDEHYRGIVEKPSFYLALTAIMVGTQLFLAGFIGELISRSSADRNHYLVSSRLGN